MISPRDGTLPNYVKFIRGSTEAYNALATKDPNTLYFIYNADEDFGKLYLGGKLIAGGSGSAIVEKLSDIADINLSDTIDDKTILMYDAATEKWEPITINDLASEITTATVNVMAGATEEADGEKGLVPDPKAGDQDSVLFGDGTWKKVPIMQPPTETEDGIAGLVPAATANTLDSFLRSDGTWVPATEVGNLQVMQGATSEENGKSGLVPTPEKGQENFFLSGSGKWVQAVGSIDGDVIEELTTGLQNLEAINSTLEVLQTTVTTHGENITDLTERVTNVETLLTWQELEEGYVEPDEPEEGN